MSVKTKHIFIFVFILSVASIALQSTVLNICKNAGSKSQVSLNNSPVSEEEDETDTAEIEAICCQENQFLFLNYSASDKTFAITVSQFISPIQKTHTPPPKV